VLGLPHCWSFPKIFERYLREMLQATSDNLEVNWKNKINSMVHMLKSIFVLNIMML